MTHLTQTLKERGVKNIRQDENEKEGDLIPDAPIAPLATLHKGTRYEIEKITRGVSNLATADLSQNLWGPKNMVPIKIIPHRHSIFILSRIKGLELKF